MKLLAIEASGTVAGVCYYEDAKIVAEYMTDFKMTHSQTLLPMMDEMTKRIGLDLKTVDAIAVSGGPGSFTGLRIGSATAKGLAFALDKPIVNVPTLDAMAFGCTGFEGVVCPMMDARRNQVFAGFYHTGLRKEDFAVRQPAFADDIDAVLEQAAKFGGKIAFVGDGASLHEEKIRRKIPEAVFFPEFMNRQKACFVASLGAVMYERGEVEKAEDHKPEYLRKSQAEREREERLKRENEVRANA